MAASLGPGAFSPLAPGQGPGWAKLAAAVEAQVPPAEIETIYVFQPIKRQGREWGTAVVTRKTTGPEGGGPVARLYGEIHARRARQRARPGEDRGRGSHTDPRRGAGPGAAGDG